MGMDVEDYENKGAEMQIVESELDPGEAAVGEAGSMMFMDAKPATAIAFSRRREAGSAPCAATSAGAKGRASKPTSANAATMASGEVVPGAHSAVRRRVVKLTDGTTHCAAGMAKLRGSHATPLRDGIGLVWRPVGGSDEVPMPPEKVADLCPYGQPGDRLWVREAFRYYFDADDLMDCIQYRADNTLRKPDALLSEDEGLRYSDMCDAESPWRSPIHMPRWASRITLEVVSVRVERLQEISREDCIAEGIQHTFKGYEISGLQHEYAALWESINGKGSWAANPFVWVVEFRRIGGGK
jgi:hypothetical protein